MSSQAINALTQARDELVSVLCSMDRSSVVMAGSERDREVVASALEKIDGAISQLPATGSQLEALAGRWEDLVRNKFRSAESEGDPMGKRFIEHGAMCYFNCAQELKTALSAPSLPVSATEEERQK